MSKSANLLHKKNLRTKEEIQRDINLIYMEVGYLDGQNHLNHDRKRDLLRQLERLNKEQVKPKSEVDKEQAIVDQVKELADVVE